MTVAREEARPLGEYALLSTTFALLLAGFLAAYGRRIPHRIPFVDVARIGMASYKIGRLIAKEEISTFVRAPVTEDPEAQEPKPTGAERALGELLTCPYCIEVWAASCLSYAYVLFPRETRFATSIFSAQAIADFLNAGFVALRHRS